MYCDNNNKIKKIKTSTFIILCRVQECSYLEQARNIHSSLRALWVIASTILRSCEKTPVHVYQHIDRLCAQMQGICAYGGIISDNDLCLPIRCGVLDEAIDLLGFIEPMVQISSTILTQLHDHDHAVHRDIMIMLTSDLI